jgi:dCTP deaminase
MIVGFSAEKRVINGKSAGLSACSYDVCIDHDLVLGPHPGFMLAEHVLKYGFDTAEEWRIQKRLHNTPKPFSLAWTVEDFIMPDDVAAFVIDKSSYARVFVSAFNTLMDPGFSGPREEGGKANLTLELVNLGDEFVEYRAGDPVCQLAFHLLDQPTDRPYRGKYFGQGKGANPARHELADGRFVIKPVPALREGETASADLPAVGTFHP